MRSISSRLVLKTARRGKSRLKTVPRGGPSCCVKSSPYSLLQQSAWLPSRPLPPTAAAVTEVAGVVTAAVLEVADSTVAAFAAVAFAAVAFVAAVGAGDITDTMIIPLVMAVTTKMR